MSWENLYSFAFTPINSLPLDKTMSRRAAVVEEFDDDTDLPLPSMPLPNTGARGPILQDMNEDSDEDYDLDTSYQAGPASTPMQQPFSGSQHQWSSSDVEGGRVADITPYKTYVSDTNDISFFTSRILIYFQLDMCLSHLP